MQTDVLIVGSGAGALTAALKAYDAGARVLVIEKTGFFGGTSAMSGGVLWLPNSPLSARAGAPDTAEEGKRYLKSVVQDPQLEAHIDAYVDTIPEMLEYLANHTPLRLDVLANFPDMYPDNPDAKMHRCHEARAFPGKELGEDLYRMRPQHPQTMLFGTIGWTPTECLILQARHPGWYKVVLSMLLRYIFDIPGRLRGKRDRRQVLGGALVGSLKRGLNERGVELLLNTAAHDFILEDDKVVGMRATREGKFISIRASKGVILASGGFEKNDEMRKRYMGEPTSSSWSAGSPGDTGEMIEAGAGLGAALGYMDEGWWGPVVMLEGEPQARLLLTEKNLPHSIIVNKAGKRFVNESSSYTKVNKRMKSAHSAESPCIPAYLIFDAEYRRRYPVGPLLPLTFQPDWMTSKAVRNTILKADTLYELAGRLGIDPQGLESEVQRFNGFVDNGVDEDFHRGEAVYDQYYGDPRADHPCLGRIDRGPYYGVRIYPGELGTKGGLCTNANAQVVNAEGRVIPGLYAIGNCSRPMTGNVYPASGATLGSAMVFGYIAGKHIATG